MRGPSRPANDASSAPPAPRRRAASAAASPPPALLCSHRSRLPARRPLARSGGLIYQLLGDKAEEAFVRDWAIGLAIDNASQWKEVFSTAVQAVVVAVALDRLGLLGGDQWLARTPSLSPLLYTTD